MCTAWHYVPAIEYAVRGVMPVKNVKCVCEGLV